MVVLKAMHVMALLHMKICLNFIYYLIFMIPATEVQNIQIGEGNVPCGLAIPIHMVFPRLFTCPTALITNNFKVGELKKNVA